MQILCSTTPMEGAFGPFVPLGRALAAANHEILVATGPDLEAKVAASGFATFTAGPTAMEGAIAAMADPAVQSAGPSERWRFPATMFGGVIAPRKLPALREAASSFRPDLILHPPVDLAGPLLAAELGLPALCYGFMHPLEAQVVAGMADAVRPLWEACGVEPDPHAGLYRWRYLDPCPPSLRGDRGAAEGVARPVRTDIPGDPGAELPGWGARLRGRRAVYVSLGTVPLFNQPSRVRALIEELMGEELELVVTVSDLHDPAALGELPENVHVERWLPLAALLPHCDAVVCHAGSGTTLGALAAGLPLVLVPDGADQFVNAESCRRAGVARVLMPAEAGPAAVREAVMSVLRDDAPERGAAKQVAEEIAGLPPVSEVVRDLEIAVGGVREGQRAPVS